MGKAHFNAGLDFGSVVDGLETEEKAGIAAHAALVDASTAPATVSVRTITINHAAAVATERSTDDASS